MATVAHGQVTQIYLSHEACGIRLSDPNNIPKDGVFVLKRDNPNFNGLYSLAVIAAVNRYNLEVGSNQEIVSTQYCDVKDLSVYW